MRVVSFFTYYHPTCRQLLELHLRTLEHCVDHFVITESSRSHSGLPAPQGLEGALDAMSWPRDRVTVINLDIPPDDQLEIQPIDVANTHELNTNLPLNVDNQLSLRARARERLQKDSLLTVLDQFSDDTVFLHSDCDEIINPGNLRYLVDTAWANQHVVIKVPLIYLQGRADLRAYYRDTPVPVPWAGGMFLATPAHFRRATPTQIRSNNYNAWPIMYITHDGEICQDLGWHFSWMGNTAHRLEKARSFAHHADSLTGLIAHDYSDPAYHEFLRSTPMQAGMIPPSGDQHQELRAYHVSGLPEILWQLPAVQDFLLPTTR